MGCGSWCLALALVGCGGRAELSDLGGGGAADRPVARGGATAAGVAGAPSTDGAGAPNPTVGNIPSEANCAEICARTTHWDAGAGACVRNNAGECSTASDCNSALPHSCLMCPDGTMACAHHECTNGACEVVTCEPPTAPVLVVCGSCYQQCPDGMRCAIASDRLEGVCFHLGLK